MTVYATEDDYEDWTGVEAPSNIDQLLRAASDLVAEKTVGAVYIAVDGLPTDTALVTALREATCAQAAAWVSLGIDPSAGGVQTVSSMATSRSRDGASVSYAGATEAAQARAAAAVDLVPAAARLLRNAGLLAGVVLVY